METIEHSVPALFAQLGLPNDEASIQEFIRSHGPLPETVDLFHAPFWTESQAKMLHESLIADDDWAIPIDQLNVSLRSSR